MKIAIIFESKTGNTKVIAKAIMESCEENNLVIFKNVEDLLDIAIENKDIDLYFLGSWTDKGSCGELMKEYCKGLSNKKIAIFGTAGFGGSGKYYESLANRFMHQIPENNIILGSYYCQGKMPVGIKNRYLTMLEKNPEDEKLIGNIENFYAAESHPNSVDINKSKLFAKQIIKNL